MNFQRLEENIFDMLKEQQIKLGYRSETVHLYYPLTSLNRFLESELDAEKMRHALDGFVKAEEAKLGAVDITVQGDRFCFAIPPRGTDYVHEHMENHEFIRDFIGVIEKHGCRIEDIMQQFYKYSDHVHVEKVSHGEFDYVVYFEDGKPDSYRYCIADEGCHMIYHRFTPEDYDDFGFSESI